MDHSDEMLQYSSGHSDSSYITALCTGYIHVHVPWCSRSSYHGWASEHIYNIILGISKFLVVSVITGYHYTPTYNWWQIV